MDSRCPLSVALGALLLGHVSAGVVRARTVRLMPVGVLGGVTGAVDDGLNMHVNVNVAER